MRGATIRKQEIRAFSFKKKQTPFHITIERGLL